MLKHSENTRARRAPYKRRIVCSRMRALDADSIDASDVRSCGSDSSAGSSMLVLSAPELHVGFLLRLMHGLLLGYLICSSLTFCSSRYTLAPSAVDTVAAGVDAATLDLASAGMFCTGFIASYLHSCLPPEEFARLSARVLVFGASFALSGLSGLTTRAPRLFCAAALRLLCLPCSLLVPRNSHFALVLRCGSCGGERSSKRARSASTRVRASDTHCVQCIPTSCSRAAWR